MALTCNNIENLIAIEIQETYTFKLDAQLVSKALDYTLDVGNTVGVTHREHSQTFFDYKRSESIKQ